MSKIGAVFFALDFDLHSDNNKKHADRHFKTTILGSSIEHSAISAEHSTANFFYGHIFFSILHSLGEKVKNKIYTKVYLVV